MCFFFRPRRLTVYGSIAGKAQPWVFYVSIDKTFDDYQKL